MTFDMWEMTDLQKKTGRCRQLKRVCDMKKNAKPDDLCNGLPSEISEMLAYV